MKRYYVDSKFISETDEGWGESAVYYADEADAQIAELKLRIAVAVDETAIAIDRIQFALNELNKALSTIKGSSNA